MRSGPERAKEQVPRLMGLLKSTSIREMVAVRESTSRLCHVGAWLCAGPSLRAQLLW